MKILKITKIFKDLKITSEYFHTHPQIKIWETNVSGI